MAALGKGVVEIIPRMIGWTKKASRRQPTRLSEATMRRRRAAQ